MLILLLAIFLVGFLILAGGIGYLLSPSSPAAAPVVQGPAPPDDQPMAVEQPPNLDQIVKDRPAGDRLNRPEIAGPPPMPLPGPPGPLGGPDFPPGFPGGPGVQGMPGGLRPPPGFPGARPGVGPKAAGVAPKFAPIVPLSVLPTPLAKEREERSLAAPVEVAVPAGGGRLLLLHLPKVRQVAVFDVNLGKVVKHIPANDDRVFIAGGMNSFVMYLAEKRVLERWNCKSLQKEEDLKDPFGNDEVYGLAMGCGSNGPLVAALGGDRMPPRRGAFLYYFDPVTGKELQYEISARRGLNPVGLGIIGNRDLNDFSVRVSTDGSLVTGWSMSGPVESNVLEGNRRTHSWLPASVPLLPTADGRALIIGDNQFSPELTDGRALIARPNARMYIPAVRGDYVVSLQGNSVRPRGLDKQSASAEVLFGAEAKSLLQFSELPSFELPNFREARGRTFDRHVFLIPDAKLLVVIPIKKSDQLVLYKADLDKALANAGVDYLFVASQPPTGTVKGESYSYTMLVRSKKGGVKVALESGPKGMTVTPAGAVSWDVPKDFGGSEAVVILKVTDSSGREVSHSFTLIVAAKAGGTGEKKG